MNVRFAAQSMRCRVQRAELNRLLQGHPLELTVPFPRGDAFRVSVHRGTLGDWRLERDPTGIWLTIPKAELELLERSLPTHEGLEREFPAGDQLLHVSFEVDVHDQS